MTGGGYDNRAIGGIINARRNRKAAASGPDAGNTATLTGPQINPEADVSRVDVVRAADGTVRHHDGTDLDGSAHVRLFRDAMVYLAQASDNPDAMPMGSPESRLTTEQRRMRTASALAGEAAKQQKARRAYLRGLLKGNILPEPGREAVDARKTLAQLRGVLLRRAERLDADDAKVQIISKKLSDMEENWQ